MGNLNEQDLYYIRGNLAEALAILPRSGKGQSEACQDFAPVSVARYPRRRPRTVEVGNRWFCADTDPVRITGTPMRRRAWPLIDNRTYRKSAWRRAVSALPSHQEAWICYCYGGSLDYDYQVILCVYVWSVFNNAQVGKRVTARVRQRLQALVWLAVQQYAAKCGRPDASQYACCDLAALVGVEPDNWTKNYLLHWQRLLLCCEQLDHNALRTVSVIRSETRTKHTAP